jgi:N-acetylglucosaminyl-diphospho-decaprenol L-rhamnosyltransferase
MSSSVFVVTVTHNTGDTLEAFLASLAGASSESLTVVIVDNASDDLALERAAASAHGATILELADNVGYGAGVTAGINARATDVDYVLITNPDVTFAAGSIDALVSAADELTAAGSFGPKILDAEGNTYPSARNLPSLRNGIGHAMFSRFWPNNPWSQSYRSDQNYGSERRNAGWLSGACLLVRKSAYDVVGGFDPRFFMYFEDVDLGARLGKLGWSNIYVPDAVVTHTGAHSTSGSAKRMERVHHNSAYIYLAEKYSAWYLGPVRVVLRLGLAARGWWVTR